MKLSSFIYRQYGVSSTKDYSVRFYKQQSIVESFVKEDMLRLIAEWIEELADNTSLLKQEQYTAHFNAFKNDIPLLTTQNFTDFIKRCDAYYEFFILSLQNELRTETQHKPLSVANLKYVDQKASGVFLKVFYSENETKQKELGPLLEGGLAIKNAKLRNEIANSLIKQFNGLGFKSECVSYLKQHLSQNQQFHAEERWFGEQFNPFLSSLSKQKLESFMLEEFDLQWMWHLNTFPRLEFYVSSSPCEHCRELFTEMREALNKKDIHIPILIYYIKPYLTKEVNKSQILLVSFDKKIIETGISLQTSYDNNIERQMINYRKYIDPKRALTLDPHLYKIISSLLTENNEWTFQKIDYGLKTLLRDNHNATDLSWLLSFLQRLPVAIQEANFNQLSFIQDDIQQIFKTGMFKQKKPNDVLISSIKYLVDIWVNQENNKRFIAYVIFDQLKEIFKDYQPHLESTQLVIMLITYLVMSKLLSNHEQKAYTQKVF